jgi:hypothetical protein
VIHVGPVPLMASSALRLMGELWLLARNATGKAVVRTVEIK